MAEANESKSQGGKSVAVNVRLKPVGPSDQPTLVNYTHVGLVQGLAYVDFGFLEPALLGALTQLAKRERPYPSTLRGSEPHASRSRLMPWCACSSN